MFFFFFKLLVLLKYNNLDDKINERFWFWNR